MKTPFLAAALSCTLLIGLSACKKEDPKTPATTTKAGGFTWKENGTQMTADSAWYNNYLGSNANANQTNIYAMKGGNAYFFEINMANKVVGANSLANSELSYLKGTAYYGSTAGSLSVSQYSTTISGTFSATVKETGGASISITDGVFTDLPKK